MNPELENLAQSLNLDSPRMLRLRLAFGLACAERSARFVVDARAIELLSELAAHLSGDSSESQLAAAAAEASALASRHRGSGSIDASGHAAVSATHAIAKALSGRALEAAGYAAYAEVYAYGAYAVQERSSFDAVFAWQAATLSALAANDRPQEG